MKSCTTTKCPHPPRSRHGVIDLETLQKFINFHHSVTLDLYGSEISSNAATYYTTSLKGRYGETKLSDDHVLANDVYPVQEFGKDEVVTSQVPALTAVNVRLRDDFIREIQAGLDRFNRIPERFGIPFRFDLPHVAFHRKIGNFADRHISPQGKMLTEADWLRQAPAWLPDDADHAFIESLMGRVVEPGKFAN